LAASILQMLKFRKSAELSVCGGVIELCFSIPRNMMDLGIFPEVADPASTGNFCVVNVQDPFARYACGATPRAMSYSYLSELPKRATLLVAMMRRS
jgi:hypothetical protein